MSLSRPLRIAILAQVDRSAHAAAGDASGEVIRQSSAFDLLGTAEPDIAALDRAGKISGHELAAMSSDQRRTLLLERKVVIGGAADEADAEIPLALEGCGFALGRLWLVEVRRF
jgi:hypothetical protein